MQGLHLFLAADPPVHATGNLLQWAIQNFHRGGPVMYPILLVSIISVTVVLERLLWWRRESSRRQAATLNRVYDAIREGKPQAASGLAEGSSDPRIRVLYQGLSNRHASLEGALQLAAATELRRASRFLPVLDTIVTLAPLLGLLGTVTGIMSAFNAVQGELNVDAVSGGIGEALIATACGLAIAMFSLIPYNYFTSRMEFLQFELETAATNFEVLTESQAKEHSSKRPALEPNPPAPAEQMVI